MAHPADAPSESAVVAFFLDPDNRPRTLLDDFELGPIAISDASRGLDFQVWHLTYVDDELALDYGDLTLTPEDFGPPVVILNVPEIANLGFAFDQNGRPAICWELKEDAGAAFYWYDTAIPGFTTTALPAGSVSPRMCLDDHRARQAGTSDVILAYIRGQNLYYRQQRDRYDTERLWKSGVSQPLNTIGMTTNLRVLYDVGPVEGVSLCRIVSEICKDAGLEPGDYRTDELCPITVRGYMINSLQSGSEAIRGLQSIYPFDMPEMDGQLVALLRGRDELETIPLGDVVFGQELLVETAREQELEFASTLHLAFAPAETGYTPTKETSERYSPDLRARSEIIVETVVNLEPEEAAQRVQVLHKAAWTEREQALTYALPESYARLVPGSVYRQEIREGVFARVRLEEAEHNRGIISIKARNDRKSSWQLEPLTSTVGKTPGEKPVSSNTGPTTWAALDLPALAPQFDTLHYLVVGHGQEPAWSGFQLQREVAGEYIKEADVSTSSVMGTLSVAFAAAPRETPDLVNTIRIRASGELQSVSDERLLEGANLALIGSELVQFRDVADLTISTTSNQIEFREFDAFDFFYFDVIRRNDGGSWIADGFQAGDEITVEGSRFNDGNFTIQKITAQDLELADSVNVVLRTELEGASVTVRHRFLTLELSYLFRGLLDTTPASHSIGEEFVFLGRPTAIQPGSGLVGSTFNLRAPSFGQIPSEALSEAFTWTGESQREWAPAELTAELDAGTWSFAWVPRFRLGTPATPIKSAYHYGYRLKITKGGTTVEKDILDPFAPSFEYPAAEQTADFGGALASPFDAEVVGLNQFTGEGRALSESF